MAENNLKVNTLPVQIRDAAENFVEKLISGLGDNLQSITIVGSSLTEDFKPGQSDINTVLVLSKQNPGALDVIAGLARPMRKKKLSAPLLMTPSYIERSRDVFGIEFLDFQLNHQTIWGKDPFAALSFEKKDVRLQCERELKAMLIRLRQGYIAASDNKKLVRDILISAAKGLTPLLRAMLWLKDIDRPTRTEPTIIKAASEFSIKTDCLIAPEKWRSENRRPGEAELRNVFEAIYTTTEQLSVIVDKLEV